MKQCGIDEAKYSRPLMFICGKYQHKALLKPPDNIGLGLFMPPPIPHETPEPPETEPVTSEARDLVVMLS